MLFEQRFWPLIADGSVTLTFRRWRRCQAVAGRRYRTPGGIIEVERVDVVTRRASAIARPADRATHRPPRSSPTFVGKRRRPSTGCSSTRSPSPTRGLSWRRPTTSPPMNRAEIDQRLERLDRASSHGPWTRPVLEAVAARPGVRAPDLAAGFGRETQPFKLDVRKLKNLGLTISLEVGFACRPRGRGLSRRGQ